MLNTAPIPKIVDPNTLQPFVDALPIPPIAKTSVKRPSSANSAVSLPYYRIPIREIEAKTHRDLPATRFWGYGSSVPGPTFETRSGEGLLVEWPSELPTKHFLPIDHNLMGAEKDKPEVRTVVHLHGAKAPPRSDGYPEDWYEPGRSATYHYPNEQPAALLWYHDHAMGINRLNILAGMFGLFIIRDEVEDALNLPKGQYEVPLVLFDRMLKPDGQFYYPVSQFVKVPWVPEFFGNALLVNGKLLPYFDVEPRKYRFRVLNGSNGRFYRLSLANKQSCFQIGTDQGLLPAPVELRILTIAPGERADVVIDFADHAGEQITLKNEALNVMQFRVERAKVDDASSLPKQLRPMTKFAESEAVRTRQLTLEEYDDLLAEPITHLLNGARWHDPVTEKPVINTTEIWSFLNLTDDTHPIHLHLVRFQILDRRSFDVPHYLRTKQIRYLGDPVPPDPAEAGWKDTVRASPGAVTRIITKFEGYTGRYVWHCHILEHEDNEMMRPYEVVAG
jgi:spore coat protein A, manganese oxidase